MRFKRYISLCLMAVVVTTLVACGSKEKTTSSTTDNTESSAQKTTNAQTDTTKDVLKNTVIEGTLTDSEKSKVVDLTNTVAKVGTNTDYTKDTLSTMKEIFKYTTDGLAREFTDEQLQQMLDSQKATKQIISVEGVTFNKISKDSEGKITVEVTLKEKVSSHTNPKYNGKTFEKVQAKYIFDKDMKVCAFAIGELE